jgi:hypothetical protein
MDHHEEAQRIRAEKPRSATINPAPQPYVGHISVHRRNDGGYLVSATGYDEQAGMLADGTIAAEVVKPAEVDSPGTDDQLALALERAYDNLLDLRLEAALRLVATIGEKQSDLDEDTLVSMLRDAIHHRL